MTPTPRAVEIAEQICREADFAVHARNRVAVLPGTGIGPIARDALMPRIARAIESAERAAYERAAKLVERQLSLVPVAHSRLFLANEIRALAAQAQDPAQPEKEST